MLIKKIFVYGSLRSDMFNYNIYLYGKVSSSKKGYIKGNLSHIDNKGYPAVIKGENNVLGELMELIDFETTLKELDDMESYTQSGDNNEYNRCEVEVTLLDGSVETAYYYEYNPLSKVNESDVLISIDSGDWKEFMLNK
ncbi:gamma-glutamylcyclotransferase family protein [Paraclostridium bifermentans]|uniref:gamma-glutamylcyclotransferase family protein n=1 Tax=Paraclostridium bifermentans TaxID=1490 RepID=UPI00359C1E94